MTAPGWPLPSGEARRLATLHSLGVLDQPQDAELDGLTRLASYICGTPTAVLNLIDSDRQWQASAYGAERGEVTRDESMCGYSILSRDVTYTPDASVDAVFAGNPHVTGELSTIRMYVAAPLIVGADQVIGTLCAFAPEPSQLSRVQIERLRDLAATTVRMLELRRAAGELAQAATRDALTGLPNRTLFAEALTRAFARRDRSISQPSLLFIDLDGFKRVNDVHGHAAGDEVLRTVSERLLDCVRATDLVARLGGDEFVVLVEDPTPGLASSAGKDGLEELASRIREALGRPLTLSDGSVLPVGGSVGIARTSGTDDSPEDMLARADAAMYVDKATRTG
ncbi:sensor domain-containing diguanylate cyclase [soil metagenome]